MSEVTDRTPEPIDNSRINNEITRAAWVTRFIATIVVLGVIIGVIVYLANGWSQASADNRQLRNALLSEVAKSDQIQDQYNKLYKEYTDATGEKPAAATPAQVDAIPGSKGDTGDKGAAGSPGSNGKDATDAQVAAAVADYCSQHGGCIGGPGQNGQNGADGADGQSVVGPQGPEGLTGPQGPPGADGKDGRGIADMTCNDDGSWTITYTDGTTQIAAATCRLPAFSNAG